MKERQNWDRANIKTSKDNSPSGAAADLRGFLQVLREKGELLETETEISTKFELAAAVAEMEGREAVMFRKVKESSMLVACNGCGTPYRFLLSIDSKGATESSMPRTEVKRLIHQRVAYALGHLSAPTEITSEAPFETNTSKNLADLPIVTHFEKDAGAFITSSSVFVRDEERGNQNSSVHRMLYLDSKHMAIRMVEGRHLHKCFTYAKEHGQDLRVAVCIGLHPAITIASAYQASYGTDEMQIANALLDGRLYAKKLASSGLMVPASSEIVLEGRILHDQTHEEWMVEMLRTYDFKRQQPVFELERILYRDNAIYYDILPGYLEHRLLMGMPVESKMYDQIKATVPNTKSVHLTDGGCNWLSAVVQIEKRLEGEPKNAILAAFSSHPSLKMVTIVDHDIDPTSAVAVEYAVATRCQADRDIVTVPGAKGSSLDPSSDQANLLTTKIGIDATATLLKPKERFEIARIPNQAGIRIERYFPARKNHSTRE
ncbi:MAG: UbiD family decarboxylase [Nitrososphaera sp.]